MPGELKSFLTDTLPDMIFVILPAGQILTSTDVDDLEQIQVELQRRGEIEVKGTI
jgi:hypothetical protein